MNPEIPAPFFYCLRPRHEPTWRKLCFWISFPLPYWIQHHWSITVLVISDKKSVLRKSPMGVTTLFPAGLIAAWKLERHVFFPSCLLQSDCSGTNMIPVKTCIVLVCCFGTNLVWKTNYWSWPTHQLSAFLWLTCFKQGQEARLPPPCFHEWDLWATLIIH